jgi:hypothetical protein
LVSERRTTVAQIGWEHFAEETRLDTVHDAVSKGHSDNESQDYYGWIACLDRPKNWKRKTDRANASKKIDCASAHVIREMSEKRYRNQLDGSAEGYGSKH